MFVPTAVSFSEEFWSGCQLTDKVLVRVDLVSAVGSTVTRYACIPDTGSSLVVSLVLFWTSDDNPVYSVLGALVGCC